jgi:hypothetical protein
VDAVGRFRTVNAPSSKKARQLCDADSKNLLGQNVINALGEVWQRRQQSQIQAFNDFPEKDPGLRTRVEESDTLVFPNTLAVVAFCPRSLESVKYLIR